MESKVGLRDILYFALLWILLTLHAGEALICPKCHYMDTAGDLTFLEMIIGHTPEPDCEDGTEHNVICPDEPGYRCGFANLRANSVVGAGEGQDDADPLHFHIRNCFKNHMNLKDGCYDPNKIDMSFLGKAGIKLSGQICFCEGDLCKPDCDGPYTLELGGELFCVQWWMIGLAAAGGVVVLFVLISCLCCLCQKICSKGCRCHRFCCPCCRGYRPAPTDSHSGKKFDPTTAESGLCSS